MRYVLVAFGLLVFVPCFALQPEYIKLKDIEEVEPKKDVQAEYQSGNTQTVYYIPTGSVNVMSSDTGYYYKRNRD